MPPVNTALTRVDDRPYFEKALRYGVDHGILTPADLIRIEADAPKGIVQIADHFGTAYLRIDLETAWVLRYELPDIFEQVIMTLRDRLQKRVDALEEQLFAAASPAAPAAAGRQDDDEESAL